MVLLLKKLLDAFPDIAVSHLHFAEPEAQPEGPGGEYRHSEPTVTCTDQVNRHDLVPVLVKHLQNRYKSIAH